MSTTAAHMAYANIDEEEYKRRIRAWTMYDWANSAFATTILAAVLPIYYSQVAGATLPSEAVATSYWGLVLAISLFIVAVFSPILGTISDIMRGKKLFLSIFAGIGIVGTGLLVLVTTGDWLMASILAILGRLGFTGSIVFYDALLPHIAKPEDQDVVSTRGYAMGYLGGGLLLAINVAMIRLLPGNWGPRLSFLSVAIWWAVFSIPLFLRVPEPYTATLAEKGNVVLGSFRRLGETLRDVRRYRELFKYLIAFLIYNDGIGTIIGVAAIYGAELGFGSTELILALLLVQFVGIPFSLIFGRLPSRSDPRRSLYMAFVLFNLVALPLGGFLGTRLLPENVTGLPLPPYEATGGHAGQGVYRADSDEIVFEGDWQAETVPADEMKVGGVVGFLAGEFGENIEDAVYKTSSDAEASAGFAFNGQKIEITYSNGPDRGIWLVEMDGEPVIDNDTGEPLEIDAYNAALRYGAARTLTAEEPGEHVLTLINSGHANPDSSDGLMTLAQVEVLPPIRQNNLLWIIGTILAVEVLGVLFALAMGKALFSGLAEIIDTKRGIILALTFYSVIAVWGFFLNSTIEFWFLAWMVAIVQGGSQALSRSMYASMTPAAKSGEFFGLFGVMEKFSAIIGPLIFSAAGLWLGSTRPAILSLIVLFIIGTILLLFVNVDEGRSVARAEDAAA
ncbi:MAG: MFS transporter [Anaerolineae bacterium]|nr:MFS transporter [Anaerolineae bacterium]